MPLEQYSKAIQETVAKTLDEIKTNEALIAARDMILDSPGRVHLAGIGKPSYVAGYIASLLSSTGTPSYVLDGTEAVHGSSGQLVEGDVVILVSNSGETEELLRTAHAARANGAKLISLTRNPESTLAKFCDLSLVAGVAKEEGGPLNRAPRASIIAELIMLQALSVLLQEARNLSVDAYLMRHPGGSLGKRGHDDDKLS